MKENTSEGNTFRDPTSDILRKGSVITIITLISRPLGYVREAIQAYLFGATLLVDAFIISFNFPELIQTLFFSGATSAFLIPVCSRYLNDKEEYSNMFSTFMNLSLIVTLVVSVLFLVFSGPIIDLIAPGFTYDTKIIATYLFIIMIPVIPLHTALSVIKAFLNAKEHFAAPELSGIIWNIAFIASALLFYRSAGIYSLAIGVTAGSFLQVAIQLPYLKRFNIHYRPVLQWRHPSIDQAKKLFAGALIATSIVPINSFVGRIIGSYLPHGEVASLSYAFRIFILPASLFAVPVYTVMFTKLSKLFHDKEWKQIYSHIDSSIVLLCITLIPCTLLLCVSGDLFVKILYERGAFTVKDTYMTNRALFGYGIGLLFYALSISLVRIFNAFHDMKTPALVGISSIILNALLAYGLMIPLQNTGISLATSIVSLYNFAVLFIILKNRIGYSISRGARRQIIMAITAGVIVLLSFVILRFITGHRTYLLLGLNLIVTAIVYGLFFKEYYIGFIKRRFKKKSV